MNLQLRHYQASAIQSIYDYYKTNSGNALIVLPTGTGKSFVIAEFLRQAITQYPETRIIVATHVKELVEQDFMELMRLWPDAPAGILSAGLGKKSFHHQIIFCSIQTAYKYAAQLGRCDILIPDEAHTIPHASEGMWRKFIDELMVNNPYMKVLGLTATDWRMDGGLLTKGINRIFTDVAYRYGILDAVKEGYLCEIVSKPTDTHLTVSGVHKRGGEFIAGELERAVDTNAKTNAAVSEIVVLGAGRKSWLVFCAGVKHAEHVRDALRAHGIVAEMVTAETNNSERDRIIGAFKAGHIRCLVGMGIFTTGFNHPPLDLIACLRPTGSAGLWVQMLGRGMRTAKGKENCLLLDFARNLDRHGPIDQIKGKDPSAKGDGEAPQKICPLCHCYCHSSAAKCPDCAYAFPARDWDKNLDKTASNAPILSSQLAKVWTPVKGWKLSQHQKMGSPVSLKIDYQCGPTTHREWACFEHNGYARDKAVRWWALHKGQTPPPSTVDEAILRQHELICPSELSVQKAGKYTEIVDRRL